MMPDEFFVKKPAGFPDHPHRGFETVTYMLEGSFKHEDFCGHKGTIGPGDLQWMTAGRGIMHCGELSPVACLTCLANAIVPDRHGLGLPSCGAFVPPLPVFVQKCPPLMA